MNPEIETRPCEPFLTLDGIAIRLRDRFVFENTSWRIKSNEHWAVIGANGAGKSTLAKALAGDLPIVRGRAVYHFLDGEGLSETAGYEQVARVAFDMESDFYGEKPFAASFGGEEEGERTVAESLLWGSSSEEGYAKERLAAIARDLGIKYLLGRATHVLSKGEAKRVLMARALLRAPKLLILDEPFEGLDEGARKEVSALIDSLMKGAMRVVLVTHRFEEIGPKITHVLCVKDCRVLMQGSVREILRPENLPLIYGPGGLGAKGKGLYLEGQNRRRGSAPQELIRMKNTTVRYGSHIVLDRIDWTVRSGENWALLGPNGAGKSKLLELITGDNVQGYANDIRLFGRRKGSGESVWAIKRKLSTVSAEFQRRYQKRIPAYDVICSGFFDSIGLYRDCTEEQHRRVRQWIALVGMGEMAHRRFDRLSHGQQRLVLLARAMVKSPLLMILDEPCEGLDYANRKKVLDLIDFIGSHTETDLIYVTHYREDLPSCMTHALVLDKGRVVSANLL